MKTRLILAEDWKEMTQAVLDAQKFLGIFNCTFDTIITPVDISDAGAYEIGMSNNKRGNEMTESLSPTFIYGLHNGFHDKYDCFGVMVDRSKVTSKSLGLYGQQSTLGNGKQVIENYVVKKKKGEQGFPFASYTLIHETIHALADHYKVEDTLHRDLNAGKSILQCREILLDRILKNHNPWGLLPEVGIKAQTLLSQYPDIKILEGYRSPERQDELFKQNPKVTNAKAWESAHQYRIAFDYCFKGKTPFPPSGDPKWNDVNVYARSIGLYSYGIEENFDDGHVQLLFGKSEKDIRNGNVDWSKYWASTPVAPPVSLKFKRDLTIGMEGEDVLMLQRYLNSRGFLVAETGAGSPGNETRHFGELTRKALARFQKAHDISPPAGYLGVKTRTYIS